MNTAYIYLILVFSILVLRIKKINIAFRTINTLFHELSHACIAIFLQSQVKQIKLNNNASGNCAIQPKSRLVNIIILLAGYSFCGILPYVIFFLISKDFEFPLLCLIIALSALALIRWIKNRFGRIWTSIFIILNLTFAFVPALDDWQKYLLALYAILIGLDNFFSCLTLIKLAYKSPKAAGDATLLKKNTSIPAIIWALGFLAISIFCLYKTYADFIPKLF
ncbi:MAG: M50 family metallopeptidase [Bacteroidales bacterium]|jgi:hypothetical protein|nr:M50 family metallopeptidase [Bacteroidales bacterium]